MTEYPEPARPPQGSGSAPSRSSTRTSKTDNRSVTQALEADVDDSAVSPAPQPKNQPKGGEEHVQTRPDISVAITRRLYTSHLLSTWNSRSFEFGAVLFLASIFPMTLLPLSIYALVRSASAILLAPSIGRAVDSKGRLPVVRLSIIAGRASVIVSCIGFWALYTYPALPTSTRWGLFCLLTLLSCVEKPSSVLNLVAIERDWAVEIAGNDKPTLQTLNARMRRIDLICKLAGPLFVALITGASTKGAIFLTLGMNTISIPIEYFAIAQVYRAVPRLREPKGPPSQGNQAEDVDSEAAGPLRLVSRWGFTFYKIFKFYFQHPAFPPSFSLALLYFTVLSFGGQMVTFLISAGYNPFYIGLVRTLSVVFELSATWIAPRLMKRVDPARAGMWFLSWQMLWLGAAVSFFWAQKVSIVAASGLVAGTILSRIGLWGYDLCAQFIIQEEVEGSQRGSFSSTEASFQNLFELLSYVTTIIWSHPSQFRYPVLLSAAAVYTAAGLFGIFLRKRRGHLVHVPVCGKRIPFQAPILSARSC